MLPQLLVLILNTVWLIILDFHLCLLLSLSFPHIRCISSGFVP